MAKSKGTTTLQGYADRYGLPLGTIANFRRRRWPLDDPEALLQKIYAAPGRKPDLSVLERLACGEATSVRVRSKTFKSAPDAAHLEEELTALRQEVARSFKDFEAEESPIRRIPLHKIWIANMKQLSALIPLANKALEEAGRLVSAEGVERTWATTMQEFKATLEQIPRRMATHPAFAILDPVVVETVIRAEVEGAFAQLQSKDA